MSYFIRCDWCRARNARRWTQHNWATNEKWMTQNWMNPLSSFIIAIVLFVIAKLSSKLQFRAIPYHLLFRVSVDRSPLARTLYINNTLRFVPVGRCDIAKGKFLFSINCKNGPDDTFTARLYGASIRSYVSYNNRWKKRIWKRSNDTMYHSFDLAMCLSIYFYTGSCTLRSLNMPVSLISFVSHFSLLFAIYIFSLLYIYRSCSPIPVSL